MIARQGRNGRQIRTLFVSDLHLGCRHARAAEFLQFLRGVRPETIYLVGDIIDGWKLQRKLVWQPVFNEILGRLYQLSQSGTQIFYTPGNHDDFLRNFAWNFDFVTVRDEFQFEALDGRRFLVTHGDKFDKVEQSARWVSMLASVGYDALLSANWWASRMTNCQPQGQYTFSGSVKRKVKQLVRYISDFERQLARQAVRSGCDGVICGHIHTPAVSEIEGVLYCNTGDWVENCTAFVEYEHGGLELIYHFDEDRSVQLSNDAYPRGEWTNGAEGPRPRAFQEDRAFLTEELPVPVP